MSYEIPPFVQRLLDERDQLADRTMKLRTFTGTDGFKKLDVTDQHLLHEQLNHMEIYLGILVKRIGRLVVVQDTVAGQVSGG